MSDFSHNFEYIKNEVLTTEPKLLVRTSDANALGAQSEQLFKLFPENLHCFGINYKSSPIEVREKFAFAGSDLDLALTAFREEIGPVVILSTCNRTEIYLVSDESADSVKSKTFKLISLLRSLDANLVAEHIISLTGSEVVNHLFRVSAGLESMILGEGQILNQVKTSYQNSVRFTDPLLNQLFQRALAVGKKIRNKTEISRGAMSVPSAALQVVQELIDPKELHEKNIMVLGSGQVAQLCLDHLHSQGAVKNVTLVKRSESHQLLMSQYGINKAIGYAQLFEEIRLQDIVLVCTSAPHYVVRPDDLQDLSQKMIICDMSLPRNVDPLISKLKNITLIDVDCLKERVYRNTQIRSQKMGAAEVFIDEEMQAFSRWYKSRSEKNPMML
ncbi:MAG: glutamyl-tRNA reductase [Candidatus Caenarcaniphilales bacterium]|nr:glutamyl-tRNA reductase [Candidatus Caenarcaniphilales bacterium]